MLSRPSHPASAAYGLLLYKFFVLSIFLLGFGRAGQAQIAAFQADSTIGCEQLIVSMDDLSSGVITSWNWVVYWDTDGSVVGFSPLAEPSFALDAPGTYTIELTVCGPGGCNTLTQSAYITIYESPDVLYSASTYSGCPPLTVNFSDLTTYPGGAPVSRFWVIEGAPLLPTTANISYTFNSPGWYDVLLLIEDENGCSAFYQDSIHILAPPVVSISATTTSACNPPLNTVFSSTVSGVGPFNYLWSFGDGTTSTAASPAKTYTATGSYTVSLTVTDAQGCQTTQTVPGMIQIFPADVQFSTVSATACTGQPFVFTNTSTPSSGTWVWNFGDGSPLSPFFSPTHTYTTPGVYSVTLLGTFGTGCSGTFNATVTVQDPPTGDFTSTIAQDCQIPSTVGFNSTAGPTVVTYLWEFGDGATSTAANPTHTYTTYGNFTVSLTLTDASGCSVTITKVNFFVNQLLQVGFIPEPMDGCAPLEVNFTDTTSSTTPIVSWLWSFGDGTTSTAPSPTHTFVTPGCYPISLTVISASGCTATRTVAEGVCAGRDATAFFNVPDTSCPAVTIDVLTPGLTEVEVLVDGAYHYTIENPPATTQIPFVPSGLHELTLISNDYGCRDTFVTEIYILKPIDSLITIIRDCDNPFIVTLIISPALADSSCGWEWDLGDGTIVPNVDTLVYTYGGPGFYPLGIDVFCIDDLPCRTISAGGLTITNPVANFNTPLDFSCSFPVVLTFGNLSTDGYLNNLTYAWSFGDGGTSFVSGPARNYTSAGTYIVSLTITDVNGCTDSHQDTVYISQLVADLDWVPLCTNLEVEFTDASIALGGEIASWNLDFGDGSSEFVTPPDILGTLIHLYPAEGTYTVNLDIVNQFGCTDNYSVEVDNRFLRAIFEVDDSFPCAGQPVNFNNLSIGTGLTYYWDFGVPGLLTDTSTLFSPSYTYTASGTYTPFLAVEDVNGCRDTLTLTDYITVDTMVVEPFSWVTLIENCNFALVEFRPSPLDTLEACSYLWNFGDGGLSTERTPVYPYVLAGYYNVSLTITNCNGCSDTYFLSNAINVIGPFGSFTVSEDSICIGETVQFQATVFRSDSIFLFAGNGDVLNYEVLFSDSAATYTLEYTYDVPGVYLPQVVVKDSTGCFTVLRGDTIRVGTPPEAAFILPLEEACLGAIFPLVDMSISPDPGVSLSWIFSDTTLIGLLGDSTWYEPLVAGVYDFTMVYETSFGCVDSVLGSFEVLALPDITLSPDTSVCPGGPIQLLAEGGLTYVWFPAAGLSDPNIPNPLASPDESTTYTVVVDNGNCIDSASLTVFTVEDLPIEFGTDASICLGQSAPLFVDLPIGLPGDVVWSWEPPTGLDDPTALNPLASPSATTIYQLNVSCGDLVSSGEVTITVNDPPVAVIAQGDTTIFPGQPVVLPGIGAGGGGVFTYTWTPDVALNCTNCETVISTPGSSIEYMMVVEDQFGCLDSASVRISVRGECGRDVFEIPNLITPNGDGANDEFVFRYEGISEILFVRIFDRWGDVVFESQDQESRWNGICHDKFCTPGVYVYTIEAICENQLRTIIAGNVTLIR